MVAFNTNHKQYYVNPHMPNPAYEPHYYDNDDVIEAREKAKDEIFFRKNPELYNLANNATTKTGLIIGGIATLASLLLTKSIKAGADGSKISINPKRTGLSLAIGILSAFATKAFLMAGIRRVRYKYEMMEDTLKNNASH